MRVILLTFLLFYNQLASAQLSVAVSNLLDPSSGVYFQDGSDPFSSGINAAGNARMKKKGLGLSSEKKYGFQGFNMMSLSLAIPVSSGCWSGQIDYFGFNHFSETRIGFCYAKTLSARADLGVRFNYLQVQIPGSQLRAAICPQIGFRYILNQNLILGWSVSNPAGALKIRGEYHLPTGYRIGVGYKISDLSGVAVEMIKEEGRFPGITAAFRYRPEKNLEIRAGLYTQSPQVFFTMVVQKNKLKYAAGFMWHRELGFSPSLVWYCFF